MNRITLLALAVLWLWILVLAGCNKSENTSKEENVLVPEIEDTTLSNDAKTSLTLEDLENIEETNFPKSYVFSEYNMDENQNCINGALSILFGDVNTIKLIDLYTKVKYNYYKENMLW